MNHAFRRLFSLRLGRFSAVLLFGLAAIGAAAFAAPANQGLKTVQNPGGGRIIYGPLEGQLTPQTALGQILHRVSVFCGDRPQLGRLIQNRSGEILAAFFIVTAKNQDGRQLAGLAIASASKTGNAAGAVLSDYAERFPSTINSMFELLKQEIAAGQPSTTSTQSSDPADASGAQVTVTAVAPPDPPQQLQPARFPDGSGIIGLPAGWTMVRAQLGDVTAKGSRGEVLRFGMTIPVIDPTNPQSRTLMAPNARVAPGNFVAIPFATDAATAFKSGSAQLAQKARREPPAINVAKVQEISLQGGKNYFLFGDVDDRDGQGAQFFVAQVIMAPPQVAGTWQMTVFQVQGPKQAMAEERSTIASIFPTYNRDNRVVNATVNSQIRAGIEQTNEFVSEVGRHMDNSDRMTAGMSDFLRSKTVIRDTETGGHARTSDDLAGLLVQANPNRFEVVPTSQYIKGIDY